MNTELLLDETGVLRNHYRDCKGAIRMVYSDTYNVIDAGEILRGYWYVNGEYNGMLYTRAIPRNFSTERIKLYDRGAFNNGRIYKFEDGKLYHNRNELDVKATEKILSDTIKQLVAFDIRHGTDIYSRDVEMLKSGIGKYILEILEMELAKL